MIRVVLDTNVVVSALLQPLGPSGHVLRLALSGSIHCYVSGPTFAEYDEVIRRPRFKRSEEMITDVLSAIRESAHWVRPTVLIRACSDPDDDIFLECAQACRASYLITGNAKDFPNEWLGTRVVTPRQFLNILTGVH